MPTPLEDLLFADALTPAQRQALADDPALADAFARWQHLRARLRGELDAALPDRRLLLFYALDAAGRADALAPEERAALDAARPALDAALRQHPALDDVAANLAAAADDFDAAWAGHFAPATRPAAPDRRPRRRRHALRWSWRLVATVAVGAFVAALALVIGRDAGLQTVATAEGEIHLLEWADGSTVRLLGGSSLTFAEGDAFDRRVRLVGRAFFDVAPGAATFTVETPTALATVLGTSFGIRADEAEMDVVLASGRLAVASKAAQDRLVVLDAGEMSRVARNALPSTPAPVDLAEALGWTGLLLFRATPAAEVAEALVARYAVEIDLPEGLGEEQFTGTFAPEQPVEEVLGALATTLDARLMGTAEDGFRLVR